MFTETVNHKMPAKNSNHKSITPTASRTILARTLVVVVCSLALVQQLPAVTFIDGATPITSATRATRQQQQQANGAAEVCLRRAGELDKCLPKLVVYGDRKFDPPRNDEQLDKHCLLLDDNLKCVSSYSRECLPPFARNLYSVVTRRLKGQFAKRCKSKEGRADFLNLMACADLKHMEPAHRCMDAFIAHLEHIGAGQQSRQIELTCCTFQLFQDCIFTVSKRMKCSERKVSSEKSIEYVKTIINSMGGDMMEFMCGRFESIQACRAGYPKLMDEFSELSGRVLNGTLKPKAASPLRPMLQLFIDSQQSNDE
uniref:Uncharacterized protein n=1 Tax=Aceria tosichella TaxID=561515 RepID=A0A6G1SQ67_9ACAR